MKPWHTLGIFGGSLFVLLNGSQAFAQNNSEIATSKPPTDIYARKLEAPGSQQTPIKLTSSQTGLPVKVLYEWPNLRGKFNLTLTLSKRAETSQGNQDVILSKSTLFLENLGWETDAIITYPEGNSGLRIKAELRNQNQDLILETAYPIPVLSQDLRVLKLTPPSGPNLGSFVIPDFTGVETISGKISLPPNSFLAAGSILHVQLLETTLAGGLSTQLDTHDTRHAILQNGEIQFSMRRGLWDRPDEPDLAFNAWITDAQSRKSFVMRRPISYTGPDTVYDLPLDHLKQGTETKRGRDLNLAAFAQTLVLGEAEFNPVNGVPDRAQLNIKLKQDRGDYDQNPILTEQTIIISRYTTRIPFRLVTDSIYFDPYVPAPILSVSLTDNNGRVHYDSGEIRAREGQNFVRLFPAN